MFIAGALVCYGKTVKCVLIWMLKVFVELRVFVDQL